MTWPLKAETKIHGARRPARLATPFSPGNYPGSYAEEQTMQSVDKASPRRRKPFYREMIFWVAVSLVAGIAVGALAPAFGRSLQPLGTVFVNAITMIVGPIVFCLVVSGIAGMANLKAAGRISVRALIYFEVITTFAMIVGLVVMNVVQPGKGLNLNPSAIAISSQVKDRITTGSSTQWYDVLVGIVPKNILSPFVDDAILQILFLAVLTAVALRLIGPRAQPVVNGIETISQVLFKVLRIVMYASPVGIFGAIAPLIGSFGLDTLFGLGKFVGWYWLTQALFIAVVLGGILLALGLNVFKMARYLRGEVLILLGTGSGETILSQLLNKLEYMGSPRTINGLVVPTGYSFNQDGTSIYFVFCSLFIAQAFNVNLDIWAQLGLIGILLLTSKGLAGVTGGGFVVLAATLSTIGSVPLAGLMLIFGINRLLGDGAALTNMFGNATASLVVARWEGVLDIKRAKAVLDGRAVPTVAAEAVTDDDTSGPGVDATAVTRAPAETGARSKDLTQQQAH